jgi:hypothetical protein
VAVPYRTRVLRNAIDAQLVANRVKEDVTGLNDGLVQADRSMPSFQMAGKIVAVERGAATAMNVEVVIEDPG